LTFDFPALKEKVLFNKIRQGVGIIHMEEVLVPHEYKMEVTHHHDPNLYGKLILAFNFFFVISFFNHFQFLVFFVSIYIILHLD
jgi:hypothetical protein